MKVWPPFFTSSLGSPGAEMLGVGTLGFNRELGRTKLLHLFQCGECCSLTDLTCWKSATLRAIDIDSLIMISP